MGDSPERTPDGRYVVIDGRRWRATDPAIPEERRAELTRILMAWRRDVRRTRGTDDEARSRAGVQAAKVALGERGTPWWEQSEEERHARWSAQVPVPGGSDGSGADAGGNHSGDAGGYASDPDARDG